MVPDCFIYEVFWSPRKVPFVFSTTRLVFEPTNPGQSHGPVVHGPRGVSGTTEVGGITDNGKY
eukprot:scaffold1184_cov132-Cylindrotheca_fusiformis.AAC.92